MFILGNLSTIKTHILWKYQLDFIISDIETDTVDVFIYSNRVPLEIHWIRSPKSVNVVAVCYIIVFVVRPKFWPPAKSGVTKSDKIC